MNAFEFVIVIVIVSFIYKLVAVWMRSRELSRSNDDSANANAALMQQRFGQLEERVRVLERIVTDDSRRVSHEIEALR